MSVVIQVPVFSNYGNGFTGSSTESERTQNPVLFMEQVFYLRDCGIGDLFL